MKKSTKAPEPITDNFEIDDKQMEQLIFDLSNTIYWHAVVRYLNKRRGLAETTLYSHDPFKQPTETARAQGIRSGLMDLTEYVDSIIRIKKDREKESMEL